jgi:hypothetical protein
MIVEKKCPVIETYHKKNELDIKLLRKRGNERTYRGWLIQRMKDARDQRNFDVCELLQTIYKKHSEFEKLSSRALVEIEIIEGWKGIDNIQIMKGFEQDFLIKSNIKDKETGEITTTTHQIPFEKVNTLFFWIKGWKVGEKHKCYDFSEKLGYSDWKELWKERKEYFELYYYPIKVLESLGIVKYSGRGDVTRIK